VRFIGCKRRLLEHIKEVADEKAPNAESFCDLFSGTATVARYFKQWYEVYSNDLLYFSYVLQKGTIENDKVPDFERLKRELQIADPIDYFNAMETSAMESLPRERRFFQNTYAPHGGRMYVNDENALRIDYARNTVEDWFQKKLLSENEYFYLIACIVEGIPFVSNISGTYGAYRKAWEPRSYKKYELDRLDVTTNGKKNKSYNCDDIPLLKQIHGDILYLDPPYTGRQYLPSYHVLETAARYDFPEVWGITGQRSYDHQKSDFCRKAKVAGTFEELIKNAQFQHIILSYSTDGLMSLDTIERIMKQYGKPETFSIYEIPYRRYKSRNATLTDPLKKLLIYVEKE
jgi:adenine-specific DNA-methyltransferase